MKKQFFEFTDPLCIIGFLATYKLAWNSNRIQKGAEIRVLHHYSNDRFVHTLNIGANAMENFFNSPLLCAMMATNPTNACNHIPK